MEIPGLDVSFFSRSSGTMGRGGTDDDALLDSDTMINTINQKLSNRPHPPIALFSPLFNPIPSPSSPISIPLLIVASHQRSIEFLSALSIINSKSNNNNNNSDNNNNPFSSLDRIASFITPSSPPSSNNNNNTNDNKKQRLITNKRTALLSSLYDSCSSLFLSSDRSIGVLFIQNELINNYSEFINLLLTIINPNQTIICDAINSPPSIKIDRSVKKIETTIAKKQNRSDIIDYLSGQNYLSSLGGALLEQLELRGKDGTLFIGWNSHDWIDECIRDYECIFHYHSALQLLLNIPINERRAAYRFIIKNIHGETDETQLAI